MKIAFISCAVLFTLSCGKSNENIDDASTTEHFPNNVGDTWLYHVIDTAFTLQNIDSISEYDIQVSVVGSAVLPGGIKSNIWTFNSPGGTDTNYVIVNADTISYNIFRGPEMVFIRRYIMPLQLHTSWEYSTNSAHDVTVDSEADILVDSRQFHAYHIFGYPGRPDEIIKIEEWLANDVGIVRRYYNNLGGMDPLQHCTTWSLVSYHLQ